MHKSGLAFGSAPLNTPIPRVCILHSGGKDYAARVAKYNQQLWNKYDTYTAVGLALALEIPKTKSGKRDITE
jgi:hypothetical protein